MSRDKRRGRRPEPLDHWPRLRDELVALSTELERFPTLNDLEKRGRYDIMRAMVRHGGSRVVAQRLVDEAAAMQEANPAEAEDTSEAG